MEVEHIIIILRLEVLESDPDFLVVLELLVALDFLVVLELLVVPGSLVDQLPKT